jgi:hypothetical protein
VTDTPDAGDADLTLWVEQALDPATRRYVPSLRLGTETIALTAKLAVGWARDVLAAAHAAAYDAAVLDQLTTSGLPPEHIAQVIRDLRADRPGRRTLELLPQIDLVPGVSASTREPFLHVRWHGDVIGQWTVDDARGHALHLLESVQAADLDTAYLHLLVDRVHLDLNRATQLVHHLGEHFRPLTPTRESER